MNLRQYRLDFLVECRILRARLAIRQLPEPAPIQPVFLIGCGRSGKSTLGGALASRPDVCFLDESRPLWIASYPKADLWTRAAPKRHGRMVLNAADVTPEGTRRLTQLFRQAQGDRPVVVQAAAVNSFRIPFLRAAFPQARFIHVVRNGLDVAKEIEGRANRKKHGWFGWYGYKWPQLIEYARGNSATADLPALCENNFDRGLLDWRLSIEAVRTAGLPAEALMEIRYDDLVNRPRETVARAAAFIGLPIDKNWEAGLAGAMHRPAQGSADRPNEKTLRIGGPALETIA